MDINEYFAAYVIIDEICNTANIIDELLSHGADFVFVNLGNISKGSNKFISNSYGAPIFFIENREDIFHFEEQKLDKLYVNIFFMMVI